MAKEKVNKSQAVRDYVKINPTATNKDVAEAMGKKGITVTPNHVANIKAKGKTKRKRGRKAAVKETPVMAAVAGGNHHLGVPGIKAALTLLKLTGGVKEARAAVEAAQEIRKML